jgi:hydrogenase nickel incorporation protein HypB
MCDVCGCGPHDHDHSHNHSHDQNHDHTHDHNHDHDHNHKSKTVNVEASLFATNNALADTNREDFREDGIVAINLISSPGSGKTTLLEHTIEALKGEINIGVIEGDIETERDAERIRAKGVPTIQLTTGGACHLDAAMVHKGYRRLCKEKGGGDIQLLFIENVGNLVCPASFDIGEDERVVLVSVPEGPDKPAKYPKAFSSSQTFVITKCDLLPYFDFKCEDALHDAKKINPHLRTMELCSTSGEGMDAWLSYLREMVKKFAVAK